jgi:hypothetical protein
MTDKELIDLYFDCFGHLDTKPGELLDPDDIEGSGMFTKDQADQVISLLRQEG